MATSQVPASQVPLATGLLAAARIVAATRAGHSMTRTLPEVKTAHRPAAQALAFYALRTLGWAQSIRDQMVPRRPLDPVVDALLLVALPLLETALAVKHDAPKHDETEHSTALALSNAPVYTPYTVVDQAVQACRPALRGLVNAVLRRYARERNTLIAAVADVSLARWNHPDWWVARLQRDYPGDWQRLLTLANQHAPLALRVNLRRTTRTQVLSAFADADIAAQPVPENDHGVVLTMPRPITQLPGFAAGWWSVQDPGAQRAAALLPLADGMRVLDACAAPGGKTAHILERADVKLLALDADATRLARVQENLTRLGLDAKDVHIRAGDAAAPADWWDGQPFDVVLVDAPCSASGIVRRHPDIRWLRQPDDIARAARQQRRILDALWPCVAPGGVLLYATCSLFAEENKHQACAFGHRHADAQPLPAPGQLLPIGHEAPPAQQHDGFYYALFTKR